MNSPEAVHYQWEVFDSATPDTSWVAVKNLSQLTRYLTAHQCYLIATGQHPHIKLYLSKYAMGGGVDVERVSTECGLPSSFNSGARVPATKRGQYQRLLRWLHERVYK